MSRYFWLSAAVFLLSLEAQGTRAQLVGSDGALNVNATTSSDSDASLSSGSGVSLKVLGQSGKISLTGVGGSNNTVTITMDAIKEVDSSGSQVGKSGPNNGQHSRETFANTDFSFSELYDTKVSGVEAKAVDFQVGLVNDAATLTVQAMLFTENGTISPTDGEEFDVSAGALKFNVVINTWPFCTAGDSGIPCRGAEGKYVDLAIAIKGSEDLPATNGSESISNFTLGGGAELVLSDRVQVDGEWEAMADGYPKTESDGSQLTITFRFPKHVTSVLYDPIVRTSSASSSESTSGSSPNGTSSALSPGAIAGIVIGVVVAAALIALAVFCLVRRRGRGTPIAKGGTADMPSANL